MLKSLGSAVTIATYIVLLNPSAILSWKHTTSWVSVWDSCKAERLKLCSDQRFMVRQNHFRTWRAESCSGVNWPVSNSGWLIRYKLQSLFFLTEEREDHLISFVDGTAASAGHKPQNLNLLLNWQLHCKVFPPLRLHSLPYAHTFSVFCHFINTGKATVASSWLSLSSFIFQDSTNPVQLQNNPKSRRLERRYRELLLWRWYTVSSGRIGVNWSVFRTLHCKF